MTEVSSVLERIVRRAARARRGIVFPDAEGERLRRARARLIEAGVAVVHPPPPGTLPVGELTLRPPDGEPGVPFHLIEPARPTEAGDAALVVASGGAEPRPEGLARAAIIAAAQFRLLCEAEPRVALLSFSTHGSARHRTVELVRAALEIVRERQPALAVGGELQGDAALVAAVAASKAPGDPVAGRANVLVFPDAASAEIGRALVERLGGARVAGPFLAGASRPVNVVSRDDPAEAIVLAAAVTALQAAEETP